jgi:hypothetical protein
MQPSSDELAAATVAAALGQLTKAFGTIGHCLDQVTDAQVWYRPDGSQNSIANLILHLAGNLRQWLVIGVAGLPDDRDRPSEFSAQSGMPKAELLAHLQSTVRDVDAALSALSAEQLLEPRRIQGHDVTVLEAIFDSLPHFVGHAHQIVLLTRMQLGDAYRFAWSPSTPEEGAPTARAR